MPKLPWVGLGTTVVNINLFRFCACFTLLQGSGIWNRIAQHKPLFAEPKGKGDFVEVS